MSEKKRFIILLIALAFPMCAAVALVNLPGLSDWGSQFLAILIAAVILWAIDALLVAATCFAVIALFVIVLPWWSLPGESMRS